MRTAPALLVLLVASLALTGCVPDDEPIVVDPEPSVSPIFESDEEALAAAEEAFAAYLTVIDVIFAEGGKGPERLKEVATDEVFAFELPGFENYQAEGKRSTGVTTFDTVSLQSADLSGYSLTDAVIIYACEDFSQTDVLNAEGQSIVSPEGQTRWPITVSFDITDDRDGKLIVSSIDDWTGEDFCGR